VYLKHLQNDLILPINVNKTRIFAQTGRWGYDVIPCVLSAFLIEKSKLEGIFGHFLSNLEYFFIFDV
jgi:hypothetical protein